MQRWLWGSLRARLAELTAAVSVALAQGDTLRAVLQRRAL